MKRSLLWKFLQVIARIMCTLMFDLKAYGKRKVPKTGGVLLVANHQSYLDPVLVSVLLDRPVSYFAKSELFENRFLSLLIRSLHAFPVRQGAGDRGAVKMAIERLNEGYVLNVYPEGTRTEDGELGPIQAGVALIVRKAQVPIVPVAIEGSFAAWPRRYKIFHPHKIRVMYGEPMYLAGLKSDQIVEQIGRALATLLADLRKKISEEEK